MRKEADAHPIEVDPVVRLHYVEVREPALEIRRGDLQRLLEALDRDWGLTGSGCDPLVLSDCRRRSAGDWTVTVAVQDEALITAVWPGFHDVALGVAFDVGSTTVAGHLCDLHTGDGARERGRDEPADPLWRGPDEPGELRDDAPGGDAELTAVVAKCLDQLVGELCAGAGVEREDILELVVVGNPIMHHLVFGFDPTELGGAPFALVTDEALDVPGLRPGAGVERGARVYALP